MSFPEDDTEIRCSLSPVTEMPPEFPEDEDGTSLVPCSICNRTFNPNALERHQRVCEKLQTKTRRKFDSTKQRQDGLDLHHSELTFNNEKEEKKKKSRWREKHKEFLRTIRAAKGSQDDEDDDGSPQKHIPSDYIQCPHCERYFGPKAADRHINWCGEQKSRLPRSHTNEDTEAVQRLKTRTKYAPPKPGQSGWKAPKKRDVISSIPPPNVGANITPPGRLITPPSPSHSHASPPYQQRQQYSQRHFSPPPLSPTRKSSLPPGPPRYGTNSLGRAAGKQFSAMLQSVTGSSPGYGNSSGYGTQSLYGSSPNQNHHQTFKRSASLRLPKRRSGGAGRMARHRDLASDMLASVTLGGKAKREEPEGDEASNMTPFYDRSPSKLDNAPYDPFSAAELQFQDLLGPVKPGGNLRSDMMGSTNSLKHFGLKRFSPERDISSALLKPRSMMGRGSLSLCSLGLDSFDFNSCNTRSPGEDSSEIESLEHSPIEMQSPVNGVDSFLHRFSPSRNTVSYGPTRRSLEEDNQLGGSRYNSRSRSVSSHSNKSFLAGADTNKRDDKVYSWRKSPSPPYHSNNTYDSFNKNSLKEMSPSPQIYRRTSPGFKKSENDIDNHTTTYTTAWSSNSDHMSSPQNYSRYFGDKSYRDQPSGSPNPSLSSSAHDSIRALRATLDEEMKAQQKTIESLDKPQRASSSSSSTDSSLLHQLSPSISPSGKMKTSISTHSSKPIFCYECGNRYPVLVAKFCCNCGAKRLVAAE